MPKILDLCSGTGSWSLPFEEAGYEVLRFDLKQGQDVRLLKCNTSDFLEVEGILAAPPCTHLAASGARWWRDKGESALLEALSVVDACLRVVTICQPQWWCLENPVGRLIWYLGTPKMYFNPCDYGDPYTKKTALWGNFKRPKRNPVEPTEGSKLHRLPPSEDRAVLRSVTPPGFARAFFEANNSLAIEIPSV